MWIMRIMGRHVGAAPDDRAQIYVDYVDYGTPWEAAQNDGAQIRMHSTTVKGGCARGDALEEVRQRREEGDGER